MIEKLIKEIRKSEKKLIKIIKENDVHHEVKASAKETYKILLLKRLQLEKEIIRLMSE